MVFKKIMITEQRDCQNLDLVKNKLSEFFF
jgi:hypothetical protein